MPRIGRIETWSAWHTTPHAYAAQRLSSLAAMRGCKSLQLDVGIRLDLNGNARAWCAAAFKTVEHDVLDVADPDVVAVTIRGAGRGDDRGRGAPICSTVDRSRRFVLSKLS